MSLLIDGYNLMHAAGLLGRGRGRSALERSRMALLNVLAASLEPADLARTIIVFDAAGAPPGLPETITHQGLRVRFSRGYATADDLIEELIRQDSAPRRLTVVSSDHRLQRAAQRRKARAVDSDRWYAETIEQRAQRRLQRPSEPAKPVQADAPGELEYWLARFDQPDDGPPDETIFPPGYGEDIE
jgi:predicted RNA-binding protein with PIN domain